MLFVKYIVLLFFLSNYFTLSSQELILKDYIIEKVEIFYTHHKSYRAYVKVKVSKDDVALVIEEIKADKRLAQNSVKKENKLKKKVKEVLKNFD